MLGTFSIEPWFKSYCLFTVWSLKFSEIANQPFFSFLQPSPLFFSAAAAEPVAGAVESPPGRPSLCAGAHASPQSFSTALGCALEPPLQSHAA